MQSINTSRTIEKICAKCGGKQIYRKLYLMNREIELMDKPCECIKKDRALQESEVKDRKERIDREERGKYIERLKKHSMVDSRFKNSTFNNSDKNDSNVMKICKRYSDEFKNNKEKNIGMLLFGNPGVGKTYGVTCIANALMEQLNSVICVSINGLLRQFKDTYNSQNNANENSLLNAIKNSDLFIIDDLGTEQLTEWSNCMLYEIIDTRYRSDKPLIITTNLSGEDFKKRYHKRINDRIFEMCTPVNCQGTRLRGMLSRDKFEQFKKQIIK